MKDQKATRKRRSYDAEFKANILKMHSDGRSVPSLSEAFGVNENLITVGGTRPIKPSLPPVVDI